jgi:YidC/Oxa1 family membrane protein insertase
MWSFIINPFITALTLFYSVTGNIVLSIVVFTVITRMLLYPLTLQQQKSMRRQQALQPKIKKLQEKYKNDKEALGREQMKLFQEEGINPFGGCLLMFVQLPIFLGLYQAIIYALAATPLQLLDMSGRLLIPGLASEIPLQSTWLGMDLTVSPLQNPFYALALPVLVMATTWAQSKLTMGMSATKNKDDKDKSDSGGMPNQAEMMQKQMTTIMPLMFGFFSIQFSVGLSIYFITSNLIGAFQYGFIGRRANAVENAAVVVDAEKDDASKDKEKEKPKSAKSSKEKKPAKKAKKATS